MSTQIYKRYILGSRWILDVCLNLGSNKTNGFKIDLVSYCLNHTVFKIWELQFSDWKLRKNLENWWWVSIFSTNLKTIFEQIFTKAGPTTYVRVILTWNDNLLKKYEILFILKCAKLMQKYNVYSSSLMQFLLAWNSRFLPRSLHWSFIFKVKI